MKINSAHSPQYGNDTDTAINLIVDFDGIGQIPFTASPDDTEQHGRDLFARAVAGEFGAISAKPAKPLPEAKAEKLVEIEAARDVATVLDVTAHGTQWQADERSQKLLSSAITLAQAGLPLPTHWRGSNNVNMPVGSIADLLAIAGAMAGQTQAAYAKSWTLKAQVEAAQTVEDVAAVVW